MAITYPTTLDNFGTVPVNQQTAVAHRERHQDVEDAVEALELKVGVDNSADPNSLDYKVTQVTLLDTRLQSTSLGLGLTLNGAVTGGAVNQTATNQMFTQNSARIHRFNDRILLNAATVNDGAFPNVTQDWQSQEWVTGGFGAGPMVSAIFGLCNSSNPNAAIGVNSAIRTRDFTSAGTTAIPVFGCAWNDNTSLASKAYGGYFEAHRTATSTGVDTYGVEIDTRVSNATITADPYTVGDVVALQIASGADWDPTGQFDASCAIQIAGNPKQFKKGIVIRSDALTDLGGGLKEAIAIPQNCLIRQWISAGVSGPFLYFNATAASASPSLTFGDLNLKVIETSTGAEQFRFIMTNSAVNYVSSTASTTGNAVQVGAGGSDANIDLQLTPKGTGLVRFGTYTATGDVVCNGYVTIKTADGTTRKLMTTA